LRPPHARLAGCSILVVEDEAILTFLLEDVLRELGCADIRFASGVREALEALATYRPDAAVLDVNLGGELAFPIAARLAAAGIPFVFATGYGPEGIEAAWRSRPLVTKPYEGPALAAKLLAALEAEA